MVFGVLLLAVVQTAVEFSEHLQDCVGLLGFSDAVGLPLFPADAASRGRSYPRPGRVWWDSLLVSFLCSGVPERGEPRSYGNKETSQTSMFVVAVSLSLVPPPCPGISGLESRETGSLK